METGTLGTLVAWWQPVYDQKTGYHDHVLEWGVIIEVVSETVSWYNVRVKPNNHALANNKGYIALHESQLSIIK